MKTCVSVTLIALFLLIQHTFHAGDKPEPVGAQG